MKETALVSTKYQQNIKMFTDKSMSVRAQIYQLYTGVYSANKKLVITVTSKDLISYFFKIIVDPVSSTSFFVFCNILTFVSKGDFECIFSI